MTEPDPRRDVGPYPDVAAALKQFAATTYGIPGSTVDHSRVVIREALMLGRVELGGYTEVEYLDKYLDLHGADPIMVQIIAGWIVRAHLAGQQMAQKQF